MADETRIYKIGLFATIALAFYAALQPCILLTLLCMVVGIGCYRKLMRQYGKKMRLCPLGRTVLITGCDTGIGFALAQTLSTEGLTVIATCLRKDSEGARQLNKIESGYMHVLQLDVTSDESVERCVASTNEICKSSGLWAVVNNAGIVSFGDVELTSMDIYRRILDVNLLGVVRVTKAFLPLVRQAKGRVVNVTSVKGASAMPCFSAYVMSKFGSEGLNDTLRLEMRRFGVKVIAVEPGNFGGTTGLWSQENVSRLRREIKDMNTAASDDVITAYGDDHLDHLLSVFTSGSSSSHSNLDPLMDDLLDAVLNPNPQYRYMTHGGTTYLDIDVLLTVWRSYLPVSLHDYLVTKFRGIPPK